MPIRKNKRVQNKHLAEHLRKPLDKNTLLRIYTYRGAVRRAQKKAREQPKQEAKAEQAHIRKVARREKAAHALTKRIELMAQFPTPLAQNQLVRIFVDAEVDEAVRVMAARALLKASLGPARQPPRSHEQE